MCYRRHFTAATFPHFPLPLSFSLFFSVFRIRCTQTAHRCGEEQEDLREKSIQTRQGDTTNQHSSCTSVNRFSLLLCVSILSDTNLFICFCFRVERATDDTMQSSSSTSTPARAPSAPAPSADRVLCLCLSSFYPFPLLQCRTYSARQYHITDGDCLRDAIFVNMFSCANC
jgi:hypothetical protein